MERRGVAGEDLKGGPPAIPEDADRQRFSLPQDKVLLLCPQSLFKVHPDNDDLLAAVLAAAPLVLQHLHGYQRERILTFIDPTRDPEADALADREKARSISEYREQKAREAQLAKSSRVSLEGLAEQLKTAGTKELNIILKGDVGGSIEVLRHDDPLVAPLKALGEPIFIVDSNPTVERIARLIYDMSREQGLPDGYRTIINTGRIGRQEVMHLHLHVLGGPEPLGRMLPKSSA